uniref:Galectin n=1 Tax=Globodera pallida TaxID=36090 RepID=A0A183C0Y8_GLOPA
MAVQTVENPPMPFRWSIDHGMQIGSEVILNGATYAGQQKQFSVNLNGQGDDVVLHVNPRFKFLEDTIVLNNRSYAGWQKEERHRNKFSVGDAFRLRIVCHHSHFLIIANDKEIARFEHRLAPEMVRSLEVSGDVVLHRINLVNMAHPAAQPSAHYPSSAPPPPAMAQPPYPPAPQPIGFGAPPPMGFSPAVDLPYPPVPGLQPNFANEPQWHQRDEFGGFGPPKPNAPYPPYGH